MTGRSTSLSDSRRVGLRLGVAAAILCAGLATVPLQAQSSELNVAVVDAGRVFQESQYGLGLLEGLKTLRENKQAEGASKQAAAKELQDRIAQSQLALSPEKLEELQKELEDKVIELRRFEDDAGREIDEASAAAMADFNSQIMPIIDGIGREQGFTLIFNKFEAGLLFANEGVDITDRVITRFDALSEAAATDDDAPGE